MRKPILTLLAAALLLSPLTAMAETRVMIAQNGMQARQAGPTEILVLPRPSARPTDYWCAAGDYAVRAMGLTNRTRLWRATPASARVGNGILFTLDETKKAEGAGLSEYGSGPRDGSMSLGMAVGSYCRPVIPFWRD
ncbi:hypothetical protein [Szabonella alba]|uniref:Uncharacterized protein n=1 Tax=Szabonella alba TaxID=2804194 RepID=A0A8K0V6H4_9RHOB|nr:hypothetical protein [Szabonella alba]MBL4916327.1 hypothetical protein [Szabonella alba]